MRRPRRPNIDPKTMNILYLHSHDAGRFASPYGYAIPTPNLQSFAESAVVFRQAHCCAPSCSPSRAALLTGQPPHECGMHGLANGKDSFSLHDPSQHLAAFLRANDYETALCGVQHETENTPEAIGELGYQRISAIDERATDAKDKPENAATAFLREKHESPFFLSVGFSEPHRDNPNRGIEFTYEPDAGEQTADDRYCRPPEPIPDTPLTRRDMARFNLGMRTLDAKMGQVLDALEASGHADDTLVIVTTDHGIAWPHAKGNLTDQGTGVMMMMRFPGGTGIPGGTVRDELLSHLDIYPTICALAGLRPPDGLRGVDLSDALRSADSWPRSRVFAEQTWHFGFFDPQRSIRTERYKYIRRHPVETERLRVVDPGPTNDWMKSLGYRKWPEGSELLYDTWLDPLEMVNRAEDAEYSATLAALRAELDDWMSITNDPFPSGQFPQARERRLTN